MPADLDAAEEVFITSTTRNLLPVKEIAGKSIGRTDRTSRALSAAFEEYVDRYVAAHKGAAVP